MREFPANAPDSAVIETPNKVIRLAHVEFEPASHQFFYGNWNVTPYVRLSHTAFYPSFDVEERNRLLSDARQAISSAGVDDGSWDEFLEEATIGTLLDFAALPPAAAQKVVATVAHAIDTAGDAVGDSAQAAATASRAFASAVADARRVAFSPVAIVASVGIGFLIWKIFGPNKAATKTPKPLPA